MEPSETMTDNHEKDYRRVVDQVGPTRLLPGTEIEIIRQPSRRKPRHVLFDFDGTLSLIREGWPEVMVPLMVEVLQATGTDESPEALRDAGHRVRQRADRQADDLPDDPPGRGGQHARRPAGGPAGLQAAVPATG